MILVTYVYSPTCDFLHFRSNYVADFENEELFANLGVLGVFSYISLFKNLRLFFIYGGTMYTATYSSSFASFFGDFLIFFSFNFLLHKMALFDTKKEQKKKIWGCMRDFVQKKWAVFWTKTSRPLFWFSLLKKAFFRKMT